MSGEKIVLAYIPRDSERKLAYRRRRAALRQKAEELSRLFGIDVVVLLYGPFDSQPEVYPESLPRVESVLSKFNGLPPMERARRMVNEVNFSQLMVADQKKRVVDQQKVNREKEVTELVNSWFLNGGKVPELSRMADVTDLAAMVRRRLEEVNKRIAELKGNASTLPAENAAEEPVVPVVPLPNNEADAPELVMLAAAAEAEKEKEDKEAVNGDEAGPSNN